ncbi:hypothetical protein BBJ28_00015899 [Nothophytophthora sp. Chile5]|nr:hypothetical protein BBJ28_00015899 [Nothophytophthora sp. Chile5]
MQYKLRALDRKIQMNKEKLTQVRERIMELGGEPNRISTPPALEAASPKPGIAGDVSIAKQKMEKRSNMDSKGAIGHERPERVEDAQLGTESEQNQIQATEHHPQGGKEVISAVIVVQRALRVFRARRRLAGLVRQAYQRVLDLESNQYFYYNRHTRLSQWETPALLRHRRFSLDDAKSIAPAAPLPTTSPSQGNPVSDAAARTIQTLFRRRVLRAFLRDLKLGNLEKVFDAGFGTWYYYNVRTQRSFWENVHHVRATAANSAIYHRHFPA